MSRTASPSRHGRSSHNTIILSSSPDLSSPPRSDSDPSPFVSERARFGREGHGRNSATGLGLGGAEVSSASSATIAATATAANSKTPSLRSANTATSSATTKKSSRKRERPDDVGDGGDGHASTKIKGKAATSTTNTTTTTTTTAPKPTRKRKAREPVKRKTSESTKLHAELQPQPPPQQQQHHQQQPTLLPSRKTAIAHLVDSDVPTHDPPPPPPPPRRLSRQEELLSQNGNAEAIHYRAPAPKQQTQLPYSPQDPSNPSKVTLTSAPPPPRTSGTNYDPIRSVSMEATGALEPARRTPQSQSPLKPSKGASASPSISSLIDPPSADTTARGSTTTTTATGTATTTRPSDAAQAPSLSRFVAVSSDHDGPVPFVPRPPVQAWAQPLKPLPRDQRRPSRSADEGSSDHVNASNPATGTFKTTTTTTTTITIKKSSAEASAGGSPANSSPKPGRQKEAPAPPTGPTGSGLLSSALFGGAVPGPSSTEHRPPTIVIELPIRTDNDRYVNFAKLAEERYGFSALHPRLAAHHERLARAAAAGATLERIAGAGVGVGVGVGAGSADEDMSLDVSEPESNADMAGTEGSGGDNRSDKNQKPKRKRKAKADEYNKDDPFIDDSEMLWQEQAAASKDGFFVYEGPLLQPGEKPAIERADGTIRRGRGRGRGGSNRGNTSGSTRGSTANNHTAAAAAGGTSNDANHSSNTTTTTTGGAGGAGGGGGGSGRSSTRGSGAVRKPRITKADRARMEQEKLEREKMAPLAAKPSTYVG